MQDVKIVSYVIPEGCVEVIFNFVVTFIIHYLFITIITNIEHNYFTL